MEEGWYEDPFGGHRLRWFSGGRPTSLVRDGDEESFDLPPTPTWDTPLVRAADLRAAGRLNAQDLRRADDGGGEHVPPVIDDRSFAKRWIDRLWWLPF